MTDGRKIGMWNNATVQVLRHGNEYQVQKFVEGKLVYVSEWEEMDGEQNGVSQKPFSLCTRKVTK